MPEIAAWEQLIEKSLCHLGVFLAKSTWYGRENEVVNLYAHRFLIERIGEGPLRDASQIGIEVAVRQIPKAGRKKLVRKDLVLWNTPLETVWELGVAKNSPAAILEWKIGKISKCNADIKWLLEYTRIFPQVLGYSICVFMNNTREVQIRKLFCGKIAK